MKFFISLSLILSTGSLFGQADCVISFNYKGIISGDLTKIEKVGLPGTRFLQGYVTKTQRLAFYTSKVKENTINDTLWSHMSSEFCMDSKDIIKNVFKKKKEYLVKVFQKHKGYPIKYTIREIRIPVEKIKFSTSIIAGREIIIIDLGEIKI